jgi:hypothetical protein
MKESTETNLPAASAEIRKRAIALDKAINDLIATFCKETGCEIPIMEMVPVHDGYKCRFKVTI